MSHFSGQKVTFGVTFRVTFGGDPESHFLVTFELLLIFRGFGEARRSAASQPKGPFLGSKFPPLLTCFHLAENVWLEGFSDAV